MLRLLWGIKLSCQLSQLCQLKSKALRQEPHPKHSSLVLQRDQQRPQTCLCPKGKAAQDDKHLLCQMADSGDGALLASRLFRISCSQFSSQFTTLTCTASREQPPMNSTRQGCWPQNIRQYGYKGSPVLHSVLNMRQHFLVSVLVSEVTN